MDWLAALYISHPFWVWLTVAAIFLAAEVSTGSGWLLWPTGAAVVVAVMTLIAPTALPVELAVFAVVTAVTALVGRRFLPKGFGSGPDINDNFARLVGKQGQVVGPFENGRGRVFIDGKEWAATAEDGAPEVGQRVEVVAAEGAVLRVRSA